MLFLLVSAFRADAVLVQSNAAQGAAVNLLFRMILLGSRIDTAGEGKLRNVQLIFQQIVYNFDHSFHRHRLLRHHQTAFGISGRQFCLESRTLHLVRRRSVPDSLRLINAQNCGQQRIILPKNQGMIKVFQHFPCGFLNIIAGKHHTEDPRLLYFS